MEHISFFITKASELDGIRRWTATPTKFAADKEKDEVTPEFYQFSAYMIERGDHPTPALVVSHFDDPRFSVAEEPTPDMFAAGWTTEMFIDGNQPKVRGVFEDTELGDALYEAVKADMENDVPHDERIRISMAWRPLKGGIEKANGVNRHLKGMVRHFAATRVPIIAETDILVEKAGVRKTKYQDASTIIGEELAATLDDLHNSVAFEEKADLLEKGADYVAIVPDTYTEAPGMQVTYVDEFGTPVAYPIDKAEDDDEQPVSEMAKCINGKMDGGSERRDAVASCLKGLSAAEKKTSEKLGTLDTKGELIEKQSRGPVETYRQCVNRLKRMGFNKEDAIAHCRRAPFGGDYPARHPQEKYADCVARVRRMGASRSQARTHCSTRILERSGLLMYSRPDDELPLDVLLSFADVEIPDIEMVEKPALDAPMGECIKHYMGEDMKRDQAIAICLDKKRQRARKAAGTEKGDLDTVLDALISDDFVQVVVEKSDSKRVMKSESDGMHPSSHYLVVVDPKKPSTWHLPVRTVKGDLHPGRMGAAWAALTHPGGYRGNKYKGPRKQEAKGKLERLYKSAGRKPPHSKAHLDEMPLEDILTGELVKADSLIDELMGELIEMTKQEEVRSDTEDAEESEDKEKEQEEEAPEAEAAEEAAPAEEAEAAPEVSPEETSEEPAAEEEAEEEEDEEKEKDSGESETPQAEDAPATDVNAPDVANEAVKSEAESGLGELDGLVLEFKSALSDASLDRTQKTLLANAFLQKMGEMANAAVQETAPSAVDEAEKFKAEMVEIVTPLADQIAALQAENAEMKARLDERNEVFQSPTPRQLQYQGVEKAKTDDGGALTADEVAKGTVNYDRPPY